MAQDMLPKDQAFSCPTACGIVPPGKKKYVSVFFHPKTLDVKTMDYVTVMPSGCASQTLVKVVGFCRGTGNPRTLQFSGDRSSPCLGLGNAACLLRAGCLLALQPLCLLPPGGLSEESVEDTWRSCACPHSWGPGGLLRLLGSQPFQPGRLSPGSTTSHQWDSF